MAVDLEDIKKRVSKKATFENAVADLQTLLRDNPSFVSEDAVFDLIKRIMILLRTRFTSPAFWRVGRNLYTTAKERDPNTSRAFVYDQYIQACAEHLGEAPGNSQADAPVTQAPQRESYLFEGQMSSEPEPPPRRRGLEDLLTALAERARASNEPGSSQDGENAETEQRTAPNEQSAAVHNDQQSAEPPSMRELEEELAVALAEALAESEALTGQQPHSRPPASKHAVRALTREKLSEQRLKELGGPDAQCSVCREDLAVGDEVQIMPCNDGHVFHPPCLKPWLSQHNSCPVCRHELPTDDETYERRKERERENAEGAKGAANAVQHNEFIFV